jgi:hypothetical protein
MKWWYWGWVDGPATEMAMEVDLFVIDVVAVTSQTLLDDGFIDNGDGTYTQLGNQLDLASDLVFNPNVGGMPGVPGWDIVGRDGTVNDPPYEFDFLVTATEVGGDVDNIELEVRFDIDGTIGQVAPVAVPAAPWAWIASLVVVIAAGGLMMLKTTTRRRVA